MTPWLPALALLVGCASGAVDPPVGLATDAQARILRPLACSSRQPQGDPHADLEQRAGLRRLNCHREIMGAAAAFLDPRLDQAALDHARYMQATDDYGHEESDEDHPLFTGAQAEDRAAAAGWALDLQADALLEVISFQEDGANAALAVDLWMDSVYHRAPLALPRIGAVGVGSAGTFDVIEVVAPWETDTLSLAPYPGRDQEGLPTSFDSDRETPDPDPARGLVGYPVTLTLQIPNAGSGGDPYSLVVDLEATGLQGPEGPVPAEILEPRTDPLLTRTVAILPHAPLAPNTTYNATVRLDSAAGTVEEQWSFTTGEG